MSRAPKPPGAAPQKRSQPLANPPDLNIGWATPRLAWSAIGRESVRVTDALADLGWRITLIGTEAEKPDEPLRPSRLPQIHWRDASPAELASAFDLMVVNVGDNYPLHAGIFEILEATPALGIFHDAYLHNLLNGYLNARGEGPREAEAIMVETYGPQVRDRARAAARGELPLAEMAREFPMTEWVARRCAGALAHAGFYLPRLAAACPGPVAMAHLPVAPRGVGPLPRRRRARLSVVTVGVMNPNKCADRVIAAIGGSDPLRDVVEYHLVGPIEPAERARLEALAEGLDFRGLRISGAVDDEVLTEALEAADIVCCLRHPVLEGASGSAIEGLLSGRPVVVADAGFYGEIPDDLVFKVPSEVPVEQLRAVLERLGRDEPLRRSTGERARAWAAEAFSLEQYLQALGPLVEATAAAAPWRAASDAAAFELGLIGLAADDPAVGRIGALLDELTGLDAAGPTSEAGA